MTEIDPLIANIQRAANRLYTEDRMTGDEMRDMAQSLASTACLLSELHAEPVRGTTWTCALHGGAMESIEYPTAICWGMLKIHSHRVPGACQWERQ